MTATLAVAALAFATTLAATPAVRALARRAGVVDRPGPRKLQAAPVPLLGGVAIAAGVLVALAVAAPGHLAGLAPILAAASVLGLVGLVDDRRPLSSAAKALAALAVAVGVALAGVRLEVPGLPPWIAAALTLLWLVGIANAVNLLDNMDGLAAGVSAVAAAFLTVLALASGRAAPAALGAAVLGACGGFLVFNRRPASIFMGDAGALFLGLVLAALALEVGAAAGARGAAVSFLVLAVPIADTSVVVASRLRRGVNPFTTPGRDHLSHRLVARGRSPEAAVRILYGASALGGVLALAISS